MKNVYLYLIMQVVVHLQLSVQGYPSLITTSNDVQHLVKEPLTVEEASISHPEVSNRLVQYIQNGFEEGSPKSPFVEFRKIVKNDLIEILSSEPKEWNENLFVYLNKILLPNIGSSMFEFTLRIRIDRTIESFGTKIWSYLHQLQSEQEISNFSKMQHDLGHSGISLARDWPLDYHKVIFDFWTLQFNLYRSLKGELQNVIETQFVLIKLIKKSHLFPMKDTKEGNIFMSWIDLEIRSYINTIVKYVQSLETQLQLKEFVKLQIENIPNGIKIYGKNWNFLEKKKIFEFWFNCMDFFLRLRKEKTSNELRIELEKLICQDLKGTMVAVEDFFGRGLDPLISQFLTFYKNRSDLNLVEDPMTDLDVSTHSE
ncbi:hypothetical protein DFH28DRAFT_942415 [Melampsora americana]|nr:hypothetical protein DFH28DRAFT_942415 [Melampsora americana]